MKRLTLFLFTSLVSVFTCSQNLTVNFDFDKWQVDEKSKVHILEFIKANNPTEVILEGFADTVGTTAYNRLLVKRRLEAIEDVLLDVDQTIRIKKNNFGEEKSLLNEVAFRKVDIISSSIKYSSKEPNYKLPQSFLIDNMNDTIIECEDGTKIEIPQNSLIVKETRTKPKGLIKFQVTEYYDVPEMIDANLTTQSGHEILETGGMLYIQAFSDDKECVIKDQFDIGINFRGITENDSMHVFTGIETKDGVDWELLKTKPVKEQIERDYFIVDNMPTFQGGNVGAFKSYVSVRLRYPVIAQEKGIQGRVLVSFIVDESGRIKNPKIVKSVHPSLDYEILRVLSLTPRWNPGTQKGRIVPVEIMIPFDFVLNSGLPIDSTNRQTSKPDFGAFVQSDSVIQKYEKQNELFKEFYLRTNKMGWINCDKFYNYSNKKDIIILDKASRADYYAIFNGNRSIMRPNSYNIKSKIIGFNNIPSNQIVKIIGFKIINDEVYFTSFETNMNNNTYSPTFERIDKEDLVDKMKTLDL